MIATSTGRVSSLTGLLLWDRVTILAALAGVTGLAWLYLWLLAGQMTGVEGMTMPRAGDMVGMAMSAGPKPWTAAGFALTFVMWSVMMVGMMLPSAAPMLLTFATVNRRRRARRQPFVPTAVFAAGYLAAWGGFGLAATSAQWMLERASLMSPMMATRGPIAAAILFAAAGLFQLTPLKRACLDRCRSPLELMLHRWREGASGALAMGLGHGLYCLGCCWLLMALMFAGGVMNLLWMAVLSVFVFVEKLVPAGEWIARAGGVAMLIFGACLLVLA